MQHIKNFDTYSSASPDLEAFLKSKIVYGDIVIFLTFDEASRKLTERTRSAIFQLGEFNSYDLST